MNRWKSHRLERHGKLLFLHASLGGGGKTVAVRLLVDTGASFTMAPVEAFEALGCDTRHPQGTVRVAAANGIIIAPLVPVPAFQCLGSRIDNFPVLAHTLPAGTFVDGLLGMDFLSRHDAIISVRDAVIRLRHD